MCLCWVPCPCSCPRLSSSYSLSINSTICRSLASTPVRSYSLSLLLSIYIYIFSVICVLYTLTTFTALVYDNHNIYVYYIVASALNVWIHVLSSTEFSAWQQRDEKWMNNIHGVCTRIAYTIRDNQQNSYAVFAKSKTINTKHFFVSAVSCCVWGVSISQFSLYIVFYFVLFCVLGVINRSFLSIPCNFVFSSVC